MPIPKDDLQASVDVFDTLEWIIVLYVGRRSETLRRRWAWLDVEKMEDGECWKVDCARDKEHLPRLRAQPPTGGFVGRGWSVRLGPPPVSG